MSIKLFFWNLRGLNDPGKHRIFVNWLFNLRPLFGALLESHVKELSLSPLMNNICSGWHYVSNHASDEDGRIILIWKDPLIVQVIHQSRQCLTCIITIPNKDPIYYSAVYASNQADDRLELWADLIHLHTALDLQNKTWFVGGDFNQIVHASEHSSDAVVTQDNQMYMMQDCLLQTGLFDLRFNGPSHTWRNSQPAMPIAKKLDRQLVNNLAISSYPHATATFLPPLISDHSPCLLDLAYQLPKAGTQPFKFQNYLTKHPEFTKLVMEAWARLGGNCCSLADLCWKLKSIKSDLKLLNKNNFSKIQERVSETHRLLEIVQVQALHTPTAQLFQEERDLNQKWVFLRQIEECFFRQKSRINWLREGDLNTTYFFRICQVRASYNAIRSFMTVTGTLITDPYEMSQHAINHFQAVLGPVSNHQPLIHSSITWFQQLSNFSVSSQQAQLMGSLPTATEIKRLFFKLNPNKSPGPDGLTSGFFRASWEIIGEEVVAAIQEFFKTSFLPSTVNATILSLVPKFPGASKITEYRPISCLNTVYKVISRLLVAKLKPILKPFILPCQTAFVKDRLLVENTILASELINGYHKKNCSKRITIKVDIAKAFDTLSWDFLLTCLESLQLPPLFRSWLKACICRTSFMIGYNGTVNGYFKGKRGLRQGDPLSPYLFVMAMNYLSLMLNQSAEDNKIKYHPKCNAMKLTHLSFADDLLIFIDGSIESVQSVLQVLREFEMRSGLAVSFQKTSFYSSGLTDQETDTIKASTGMSHGELPFRYLGVPLNSRKLSLPNCQPLIQQVKARLSSWSVKTLSFSGRLLLIKTVISGINTFWCSAFLLPKACICKINSMCNQFLWHGTLEGSHSTRVAWTTVTLTKAQGGLGIKDLQTWNTACCMRLIWMLFFREDSVWVSWFKEVILNGSVHNYWTVKPSQACSWLVNKLIKMRPLMFPLIKMKVENGRSALFWHHNWAPQGCIEALKASSNSRLGIPHRATVASLCRNGNWCLPPARSEAAIELYVFLTTIQLTSNEDSYEWSLLGNKEGRYSTGSAYTYLKGEMDDQTWTKAIWFPRSIPRHSFHSWLVYLNRCPTRDRMIGWGLCVDPVCLLCNSQPESRDHLFYDCDFSFDLWTRVSTRCRLQPLRSWGLTVAHMESLSGNKATRLLTLLAWQATTYWLWNERNGRLHATGTRSVAVIFKAIDHQIRNKIQSFRETNPNLSSVMMQLWFATA